VAQLRRELTEVVNHRELTRKNRDLGTDPVFAIVGYANVGKSTLLNALTGADILAEDKLFATLDTTTRAYEYSRGGDNNQNYGKEKVLLIDTVGFIRKLPHNLVDAFRSTLEEAGYADYIIHVVDASSPDRISEMKVVYDTLDMLGIEQKKVITIFNKIDKIINPDDKLGLIDKRATKTILISAKERIGLDQISTCIDDILREDRKLIDIVLSYQDMSLLSQIKKSSEIVEEEYLENGVRIKAFVSNSLYGKLINTNLLVEKS
jgi:GTP-binding protein HflX